MKKPEELRQVTEDVLGGLSATDELKKRILYNAANTMLETEEGRKESRKAGGWMRAIPALCCCLVLVVCASVLIPKITSNQTLINESEEIPDTVNGDTVSADSEAFPEIIDMAAGNYVVSPEQPVLASTKVGTSNRKVSSNPDGGIFADRMPGAEAKAENPYLIVCNDGKFYRLTDDLFAENELALSGSSVGKTAFKAGYSDVTGNANGNGSTCLPEGTALYTIEGMNSAFLAARVESGILVFQRISAENIGLLAGETLNDVIPSFDRVVAIDFSDRDSITDRNEILEIGSLLKEYAIPEDTTAGNGGEKMILNLDNGMRYQLTLDGGRICGCGTWLCPELFDKLGR